MSKTGLGDPARGSATSVVPLEVCDIKYGALTNDDMVVSSNISWNLCGLFIFDNKLTVKQITLILTTHKK